MIPDPVTVPLWLDLPAVVISALGGALVASRAGFDLGGVFGLGLLTGLGGGILRDILLNQVPVALQTPEYIIAAVLASALIAVSARSVNRYMALVIVLDAAALGLYGMTGINKTLALGFDAWSAVLVGMVAALGGGVLRDLSTAKTPEIFRGGQIYATAVLIGLVAYLITWWIFSDEVIAVITGVAVTFIVRIAAWRMNLTLPGPRQVPGPEEPGEHGSAS
ncbi:MAG: TRIC cation channel family protein [Solirubrobacterales bacterium]